MANFKIITFFWECAYECRFSTLSNQSFMFKKWFAFKHFLMAAIFKRLEQFHPLTTCPRFSLKNLCAKFYLNRSRRLVVPTVTHTRTTVISPRSRISLTLWQLWPYIYMYIYINCGQWYADLWTQHIKCHTLQDRAPYLVYISFVHYVNRWRVIRGNPNISPKVFNHLKPC